MKRYPLLALMLLLPAGPALAQASAPRRPQQSFNQLFPKPTGKNGYEELVLAGDLVSANDDFQLVQQGGATLTFQRQVVRQPSIQKALALLRRGLSKQTFSPREELHMDTLLPELAQFRALGRLLSVVIHVQLADGQTGEAIESARLGLRLGKATDTDTVISGLVATAINIICTNAIANHLDQLSARDCEALYRLCMEWLQQPDPIFHALQVERGNVAVMIADLKHQTPDQWIENLGHKRDSIEAAQLRRIGAQPDTVPQILDEVGRRLDEYYAQALKEAAKPVWQREWVEDPPPSDPASYLVSYLKPSISHISYAFARDQARMRLLACHAVIQRYRWEHNQLPETLEQLRLGELTVDPFSGGVLQYEVTGSRYRLISVGPPAAPDNPMVVNGRSPVSVTPGQ